MDPPAYRSPRTAETYSRAFSTLRQALNAPPGDLEFLRNPAAVIQWIESLDRSVNTKKIYYIAIVSYIKPLAAFADVLPHYKAKMDGYNAVVGAAMERQEMSPAEAEKFLPWPEVLKAREAMRVAAYDLMSFQDYVLVLSLIHI